MRAAPGYARYLVSEQGVVFNCASGHEMAQHTKDGYARCTLVRDDGVRRNVRVCCLVLLAHVGPRPSRRHHAAHGDGDLRNNALINLRWALPEENEADKKPGRRGGGRRKKLPTTIVRSIVAAVESGTSLCAAARMYGVHRKTVARVCARA